MDFSTFAAKVVMQDKRNIFASYTGDLDIVPEGIRAFYRCFNPVDVEVDYDGLGISFCPADDLPQIQDEYSYLNAQFVFATCNADPIFLHDNIVYTCPHGIREPVWEKLTGSFIEYLGLVVDEPK